MAGDKKKARFMSTAGPSIPVSNRKTDDVVPPGSAWLEPMHSPEALEALADKAKESADGSFVGHEPDAFSDVPSLRRQKPATGSFKAKSAHSLVEELNASAQEKKALKPGRDFHTAEAKAITAVEIAAPQALIPKKRLSARVWVLAMLAFLGAIIAFAWVQGFQEPAPESARDHSELAAQVDMRRQAVQLVNQAHELAIQGSAKTDEALKTYRQALNLDPELASAHKGLGSVLLREKKIEAAMNHYRKYLILNPKAADRDEVRSLLEQFTDDPMRPKGGL